MEFNQNRLRIVHCEHLFENCEEIKHYVYDSQFDRPSLYAEPMIFKYGEETNPNIVLAIGSVGDGTFKYDANGTINKVFFIDFAKAEEDIKELFKEVEINRQNIEVLSGLVSNIIESCGFDEEGKYVADVNDKIISDATSLFAADKLLSEYIIALEKRLTLYTKETPTIKLGLETGDTGTTISGDVKLGTMIYKNRVINNNIAILDDEIDGVNGIFSSIDLDWNEGNSTLTLTINGGNEDYNGFTKKIELPTEAHVISGTYNPNNECLELILNNDVEINGELGHVVSINLGDLINEWTVYSEGDTKTPIVLYKEKYKSSKDVHDTIEEWQDILTADVRILSQVKLPTNILMKDDSGKFLYVDGSASAITYTDKEGKKVSVQTALDNAYMTVSEQSGNTITAKKDGIYSYVNIDYETSANTLVFKTSDKDGKINEKKLQLNCIQLVKSAYYRSSTEEIVITYTDASGNLQELAIPIGDVFNDFTVDNTNKTVSLVLTRNTTGPDTLSADVNVASGMKDNILEVQGHALYVKGTADNIVYTSTMSVEDALDLILGPDDMVGSIRNLINNEAVERKAADEQLKNDLSDETVRAKDAEKTLNEKVESIDLTYNNDTNVLTFINSLGEEATLPLNPASKIDSIYYSPLKQTITLSYTNNDDPSTIQTVECSVRELYNEWDVDNKDGNTGYNNTVTLVKHQGIGDSELDVLSAYVNISSHEDNILVNQEGFLYVSSTPIYNAIKDVEDMVNVEIDRAITSEDAIQENVDNVQAELDATQIGAGLNEDGTYTVDATTTYLREASSLKDADRKLDSALNELNEKVTESVEKIDEAVENLNSKTDDIQAELDATQEGSGLNEDGSYKFNQESTYLHDATSLNDADLKLDAAITTVNETLTEAIENLDEKVDNAIEDLTVTVSETDSLYLVKEGNNINGYVKINTELDGNIIRHGNTLDNGMGLFATVSFDYNDKTNEITFTRTDANKEEGISKTWTLNSASVIDKIWYDDVRKEIVIVYHSSATGEQVETRVPVGDLFNEWTTSTVDAEGKKTTLALTRTSATTVGGYDILYGNVEISDKETNILQNDNGYLLVDSKPIDDSIQALHDELDKVELNSGLNENGEYQVNTAASYINIASNLASADDLLDTAIKNVSDALDNFKEETTATLDSLTAQTSDIQAELDKTQEGSGLNEDGSYKFNQESTYLHDATSLNDADLKLDAAITTVNETLAEAIENLDEKVATIETEVSELSASTEESLTNIQAELDATQAGAGLNEDGSYKFNQETSYLHDATSLNDADLKLDAAITTVSGKVDENYAELSEKVATIETEVSELSASTEESLTNIQAELDKTQEGAGLNEDGSYIVDVNASYIRKATSLAEADSILDSTIDTVSGTVTTVSGTVESNYKELSEKIKELEGEITGSSGTTDDKIVKLQAELDKTQDGAGLNEDGSYKFNPTSPYINVATSLNDADTILAEKIKDNADAIDEVKSSLEKSLELDNEGNTVYLERTEEGKLKANAVINDSHDDNILINDNGSLYVSSTPIYSAITKVSGDVASDMVVFKSEIRDIVNEEEKRALSAETEINQALNNLSASTVADMKVLTNTVSGMVEQEYYRAVSAETELGTKIDSLSTGLTNDMEALQTTLEAKMTVLTNTVSGMVHDEEIRAVSAETHIMSSLTQSIEDAKAELTINPTDTDTIDMVKDGINLSANAIISSEEGNIITRNNGLYASVTFEYDETSNSIIFTSSNGGTKTYKLASVSAVDKIYYDGATDELVFEFTTSSTEEPIQTRIPAAKFFKGIVGSDKADSHNITVTTALTQGDNSATAITANLDVDDIISTEPMTVILKSDGNNKLTANVHIASNVPHNILRTDNEDEPNSLFVLGTSKNIYLESPIRDSSGNTICNEEGVEDCISDVDAAIQYLVNEINKLSRYMQQSVIDTASIDLVFTRDDNQSAFKAYAILSNDCHNLLNILDDGMPHRSDDQGHLLPDVIGYDEDGKPIYADNASTNGIFFDGNIDYGYFNDACKRYLQLKRNTETLTSAAEVLALWNSSAFLSDKRDGEPVVATYTDGNRTNIMFGIVREVNGAKQIYVFSNKGTVIDRLDYHVSAETIDTYDAYGNKTTTEVPAESLYLEYTDGSNIKHTLTVDMTNLIEEFTFPAAHAKTDGSIAVANGINDNKASDAAWGATYAETSARTFHNVQFDIERKKDEKTIVKADVDYFDCGEY